MYINSWLKKNADVYNKTQVCYWFFFSLSLSPNPPKIEQKFVVHLSLKVSNKLKISNSFFSSNFWFWFLPEFASELNIFLISMLNNTIIIPIAILDYNL